jgi:hypothetical protein
MELGNGLNLCLKDFMLFGRIGNALLGQDRIEIERVFGKNSYEDFLIGERSSRYIEFGLSFDYYKNTDKVFNISLTTDVIKTEKNQTEGLLKKIFEDYSIFYLPAKEIFTIILENEIDLYFIEELSGNFSNYYYVTSNNVRLLFDPYISEYYNGAQLATIGTDAGCMQQARNHNAIKISFENMIIPPFFDEVYKYPKGNLLKY